MSPTVLAASLGSSSSGQGDISAGGPICAHTPATAARRRERSRRRELRRVFSQHLIIKGEGGPVIANDVDARRSDYYGLRADAARRTTCIRTRDDRRQPDD